MNILLDGVVHAPYYDPFPKVADEPPYVTVRCRKAEVHAAMYGALSLRIEELFLAESAVTRVTRAVDCMACVVALGSR